MNVLLFGGTSGIGKSIYKNLRNYCNSIIVIVRDKKKFNEIFEKDINTKVYQYDLSDSDNLFSFLSNLKIENKLNSLIYSVGIESTLPLKLVNRKEILNSFNVNFFSAFESIRFFSSKKNSFDGSSVILLSSVMSELGSSGKTIYCSSKAALNGLVRSSSVELAKRKIRVNAISPSIVDNKMGNSLLSKLPQNKYSFYNSKHILGLINHDDINATVDFLISEKSSKITGQNIKLDSGYSLQ